VGRFSPGAAHTRRRADDDVLADRAVDRLVAVLRGGYDEDTAAHIRAAARCTPPSTARAGPRLDADLQPRR
jgi:hypothetical protein